MRSVHATLTAATVATQTLTGGPSNFVVVHVRGAGTIFFTVNGAAPTVGGANTYVVHSALPVRTVQVASASSQAVRLISTTAAVYSVEAI